MNIGEIKKPSVDGDLVKPKQAVATAAPVVLPKAIGDQIDISIKAKERYLEYNKKNKKKGLNQIKSTETEEAETKPHIDIIA